MNGDEVKVDSETSRGRLQATLSITCTLLLLLRPFNSCHLEVESSFSLARMILVGSYDRIQSSSFLGPLFSASVHNLLATGFHALVSLLINAQAPGRDIRTSILTSCGLGV
jgi:hypothetical protein